MSKLRIPRPIRRVIATFVATITLGSLCVGLDSISGSLLPEAMRSKHYAVAKVLVVLGANADARTNDDSARTSLHSAAEAGEIEMIKFLICHGATVDARATFDVTPRAEAQVYHQVAAERTLVAYGARPIPSDLHVP